MGEFVEHRFDYSQGRPQQPELTVIVGPSGSGKSTLCKQWMNWSAGTAVRLNRDDMRKMLYVMVPWEAHKDSYVRIVEAQMARMALYRGLNVYIDDTNCIRKTRYGWEELAKECRVKFRIVLMTVPTEECIKRDAGRPEGERVGEIVIRKQFKDLNKTTVEVEDAGKPQAKLVLTRPVFDREALRSGGFTLRLSGAPIVIYDVDGTLTDSSAVRNPYDESRVLFDKPYQNIVAMAQKDYETKNLFIVSGRHDKCGDDTVEWMNAYGVKFDLMLMRRTKDNRHDTIVKEELLDELLAIFDLKQIEYVVDDRPQVIRMWRRRGLKVIAARGEDLPDF